MLALSLYRCFAMSYKLFTTFQLFFFCGAAEETLKPQKMSKLWNTLLQLTITYLKIKRDGIN